MNVHRFQRIREDLLLSWLVGGTIFLGALVLWLQLKSLHPLVALITFMPAITVVALAAGWRVASLVTLASALAGWWLLLRQPGITHFPRLDELLALGIFTGSAAVIVLVVESLAREVWRDTPRSATARSGGAPGGARAATRVPAGAYLEAIGVILGEPRAAHDLDADNDPLAAARARVALFRRIAERLDQDDDWPGCLRDICREILATRGADLAINLDIDGAGIAGDRRVILAIIVTELLLRQIRAATARSPLRDFTVILRHLGENLCALDIAVDAEFLEYLGDAETHNAGATVLRNLTGLLDATLIVLDQPLPLIRVIFRR